MDIREIEQYLVQLKSVRSCRILLDEAGTIQEIHVVSDLKRSPKQISRDIQSILISKYGLDIDYKKISIAQVNQDSAENTDFRLKLKTIEYTMSDKKSEVKVILEKDDESYEGSASGASTSNNILRMLGKATLNAVEEFCETEDTFIIDDVRSTAIAGKEVMLVAVTGVLGDNEYTLSGSAMVDKDRKESVVKATLNAVNRMVTRNLR